MKQQNNCSPNKYIHSYNNTLHLQRKFQQMMMSISDNQSQQAFYSEQMQHYEEQFSQCSKRKHQLLSHLNLTSKPLFQHSLSAANTNNTLYQKKGFQKLEHPLKDEKIQTDISINMVGNQGVGLIDFKEREVLGERRGGFGKACEEKSFGFIPCHWGGEQLNENERGESMENLSLRLIPQSPRVVQNLIVYRSM